MTDRDNHWGRWITAILFVGAIAVTSLLASILGLLKDLTTPGGEE